MYFPLSKISDPKHTSGDQYIEKQSKKQYIGTYFVLSDGRIFSGNGPNDINVRELIKPKVEDLTIPASFLNFEIPKYYYPIPTESDYKIGFMIRYFLKKKNLSYTTISEVSPDDYKKFVNDSQPFQVSEFSSVKLNWKLTGPLYDDLRNKNFPKAGIIDTNQRLVKLKDKVIPGFSLFIKDYSQFSRPN
jgi:hypothetical protein